MDPAPTVPFEEIAARAVSLGASLVGAVTFATLLRSTTHGPYPACRRAYETGSVIVVALAHTEDQPDMDWWDNRFGRTRGNRRLMDIDQALIRWLKNRYGARASQLPYQAAGEGIFLKDAAVLAGLGVIGRNNLLVTPRFGPRVRLRALRINRQVKGAGPLLEFAPCSGCDGPCLDACPVTAFDGGRYQAKRCRKQMRRDEADRVVMRSVLPGIPDGYKVFYCRRCELACPVGKETPSPRLGCAKPTGG